MAANSVTLAKRYLSVSGLTMRYISSGLFNTPLSRKASSTRSNKHEIFSKAIKSLCPQFQSSEIDPRDRPRTVTHSPINELPIMHVKATGNNTIITITDSKGKTLAWTSAGAEGFKNSRRGTTFAAQSAGTAAGMKASGLGINRVKVNLKGIGPGRQHSLKGIEVAGIEIAVIQDVTPIPHNGCKPRKAAKF